MRDKELWPKIGGGLLLLLVSLQMRRTAVTSKATIDKQGSQKRNQKNNRRYNDPEKQPFIHLGLPFSFYKKNRPAKGRGKKLRRQWSSR